MSTQYSPYTGGGDGGGNRSGPTPIQADFEENLKIQQQQSDLYSKLEVLGASKDISSEVVQTQISDIFKQIETLNKVKNSIFQSLLTSFQLNQSQLNASRYTYADSITALQIIEENLRNKQNILNDALAIRDSSERMVGVNTYYSRRYEEHSNILKYVILFCGIIILAIFLMKIGIVNNTISSIIIIASLAIGIIIIGGKMWDLSRRSNIDYDQYNFRFDPSDAPRSSNNTTNVKTDMTYGKQIFGNVCDSISKGASDIKKSIQKSTGDYESAAKTTGTGGAGKVETFILKNCKNKYNQGDNTIGSPLASNETSYNYSDYPAY